MKTVADRPVRQPRSAISPISIRAAIIVSLAMAILAMAGSGYAPDNSARYDTAPAYEAATSAPSSMSYEVNKACVLCVAVARTCVAVCHHASKAVSAAKKTYKVVKSIPRTVNSNVKKVYSGAKKTYNATKDIRPTFAGPKKNKTFFQIGLKNRSRGWSHSIGLHPNHNNHGIHIQRTSKNTGQSKARHKRWP